MESADSSFLIIMAIIWLSIVVYLFRITIRRSTRTVGLPLLYAINLSLIHWFGALVNVFPWYPSPDKHLVIMGFFESLCALIAFSISTIIIAPFMMKSMPKQILRDRIYTPHPKLAITYIVTALILYFLPFQILRETPTVRSLIYISWNLFVSGVCLMCWVKGQIQRRQHFMNWMAVAIALPFFTTVTQGFMGYGTFSAIAIIIFVSVFFYPRRRLYLFFGIVIYLGLSLFVTYMKERGTIREAVWGGAPMTVRFNKMYGIVKNFEFIDFKNLAHLEIINGRINQNLLIGRSVEYLKNDGGTYARGETISESFLGFVPRILWPEKKITAGGSYLVAKYTGAEFSEGTSVAMGQVMELYVNFGTPLVITGFLIIGAVLFLIDVIAKNKLVHGDWQGFILYYMLGMALIQSDSNFAVTTMTVGATFLFYFVVNKLVLSMIIRNRSSSI